MNSVESEKNRKPVIPQAINDAHKLQGSLQKSGSAYRNDLMTANV